MDVEHYRIYLFLLAYYVAVSVIALLTMAHDKLAARGERQRVAENSLHLLSVVGGWPGTWLACGLFRHKIRKSGFQLRLTLAALMNIGLLIAVLRTITSN